MVKYDVYLETLMWPELYWMDCSCILSNINNKIPCAWSLLHDQDNIEQFATRYIRSNKHYKITYQKSITWPMQGALIQDLCIKQLSELEWMEYVYQIFECVWIPEDFYNLHNHMYKHRNDISPNMIFIEFSVRYIPIFIA